MRAGTHIMAGIAVAYALGANAGLSYLQIGALGAVGGLCALIPDIDHPQSAIRRKTGILGTMAAFWMNHRGITHTLLAAALVALLSAALLPELIAATIAGAYLSHLVLDACTISGVPLLGPLTWRRFHLLPAIARVRTGSLREQGALLAMVVVVFLSEASRAGYL